ncbi:hypothetical protein BDE02_02G191200 [Populus trichocarpa]|nr:hypothetical protein BDE02_02G191200 [Populus trichocarpa]
MINGNAFAERDLQIGKFRTTKRQSKVKRNSKLGGAAGLSLEAFINAKSNTSSCSSSNPALIKKRREFYENAKYVSKFKKKLKQQNQPNELSSAVRSSELEGQEHFERIYEKWSEEEEKARIEREVILKAKKEERENAESCRKAARKKTFKNTCHGQLVLKYWIEHLSQTVQGSIGKSINKDL